jgi:hypothetical protein
VNLAKRAAMAPPSNRRPSGPTSLKRSDSPPLWSTAQRSSETQGIAGGSLLCERILHSGVDSRKSPSARDLEEAIHHASPRQSMTEADVDGRHACRRQAALASDFGQGMLRLLPMLLSCCSQSRWFPPPARLPVQPERRERRGFLDGLVSFWIGGWAEPFSAQAVAGCVISIEK